MICDSRIRDELGRTLESTHIGGLGERTQGKVRDSYRRPGIRIIIATDRISAFDCVLGTVPFKGQVLNQLAAFWFEKTGALAPNHVVDVPDPNVMVVEECDQLAIEFVVRGYITGITNTSPWTQYQRGIRDYCGHRLPDGLRRDQKLDAPILTPTTKFEKHDRPLSRQAAIAEGLIDAATFDAASAICLKLYDFGARHAARQGLILADTKYELGHRNGAVKVTDEMHTPDSSRYWFADTYRELFDAGRDQRKLDKEYVREWCAGLGFRGDGAPPAMPDEVRVEAAKRYIRAYEIITGREFKAPDEPVGGRIESALKTKGYLAP